MGIKDWTNPIGYHGGHRDPLWKQGQIIQCFRIFIHRVRYRTTVIVTLASGLSQNATSAGIVVDLTPPQTGAVTATVPAFVARGTAVMLTWSGFADPESGIAWYQLRLYGAASHEVVLRLDYLEGHSYELPTDGLPAGRYFFGLVAVNGVNYTSQWNSSEFSLDATPPTAGLVWVGPDCATGGASGAVGYQRLTNRTAICWDPMPDTDGYGGTVQYEVLLLINSLPHQANVTLVVLPPGTTMGTLVVEGLDLSNFDVLTARVTARNQAGLRTAVTSGRVVVDCVPPRVNFVRDGLRLADGDLEYTADRQVGAVWSFSAASGLVRHRVQVRVGACVGAALTGWTALDGTASSHAFPTSEVQHDPVGPSARRLVVAVEATSGTGMTAEFCSNGAQYEGSGPAAGSVWIEGSSPSAALVMLRWPPPAIAASLPADTFNRTLFLAAAGERCLTVGWAGFTDNSIIAAAALAGGAAAPDAGVAEYRIGFGLAPGLTDLVAAVSGGLRAPYTACRLPLGQALYATVCAHDAAGRQACASSPRAVTLLDPGRPAIRSVVGHTPTSPLACGPASDSRGSSESGWVCRGLARTAGPLASRRSAAVATGGLLVAEVYLDGSLPEGLCAAQWWVGSSRLLRDVVAPGAPVVLSPDQANPLVNVTIPLRADLAAYYLVVEAYSCLGQSARSTVALHVIRSTPALPAGGQLTVGTDPETGAMAVTWPAWTSTPQVPLETYQYRVRDTVTGATASGSLGPTQLGVTLAASNGSLALVAGRRYEVHVWAYSTAPGAVGLATTSFIYDQSPPTVALTASQEALSEADLYAMAANASAVPTFQGRLCAQWVAADPQSRVREVAIRFGTAPGLADLGIWNSSSGAVNSSNSDGPLAAGACVGPLVMVNPLLGHSELYASLTAINGLGQATTASARVRPALMPGAGRVTVGCPEDLAANHTAADGAMGLQAAANHVCAQWGRSFEAPTDDQAPIRYEVVVERAPGSGAIPGLNATLDRTADRVHFDAAGLLAEGEAYWVRVTGTAADGRTRTALSRGMLVGRRAPEVVGALEAQFVCLPGGASALATGGVCGRVGLRVAFTEAGLLAASEGLAKMGMTLLDTTNNNNNNSSSSSTGAVVARAEGISLAGLGVGVGTTDGSGQMRYGYTHELGALGDLLACGRRYRVVVTLTSGLGAASSPVTSGEFQLCPRVSLTAAYNAVRAQVEGTFAMTSFHYTDGQLSLACSASHGTANNGTLVPVLEGQRLAEPARAYTVSAQPQFGLLAGGAYVLPLPNLAALKLANGAACAVTLRAQYRTPADQTPPEVVAVPAVSSGRFTVDTTPPALVMQCRFVEGQWWPVDGGIIGLPLQCAVRAADPESRVTAVKWSLGSRPNGTDLLAFTECPLSSVWTNGTVAATCVAPAALASRILQNGTLESIWVSVLAANEVGLQAGTAAVLRVERTEPGLREAWLECAPEAAGGGWVAAVGWRELFDMQSGVANLTVALFDGPTGAALGRRVLPEVGTPQPLVAPSPDPTGRVAFPLAGAPDISSGHSLCPFWAQLAFCDRAGQCRGRTVFG
ncbi:hypothetical protein PAPYR_8446 [Paratrimastix pyriformis]|uniref:Uncharacterized protein n=1 Tax=Paratrimastix pyriformis TaxID=342808 RepID=A0ABQ8UG08_9EUKA|nr:hypothetical protein PAPYR_8446 [Paratrimastix pyriformis]